MLFSPVFFPCFLTFSPCIDTFGLPVAEKGYSSNIQFTVEPRAVGVQRTVSALKLTGKSYLGLKQPDIVGILLRNIVCSKSPGLTSVVAVRHQYVIAACPEAKKCQLCALVPSPRAQCTCIRKFCITALDLKCCTPMCYFENVFQQTTLFSWRH